MNAMTRLNPFRAITRSDPFADLDEVFRTLAQRSPVDFNGVAEIRMDLAEDPAAYHVKLEIPGVKKEDVELTIDRNLVTITTEVKRATSKKDERSIREERYYGQAYRSFSLPQDVDAGKAKATYGDGILTLDLPKLETGSARRIPVQ